ncbi:MAG: tyrosine-protein phosphatase [Candidatus Eremiobacteraeota bacterium]|nr:tyrosine-protein phosphatase [Candidatus Eremiobacteraeota bacterium]
MVRSVRSSAENLRQSVGSFPATDQAVEKIHHACKGLDTGDSVELKRDIREHLWTLRQALPEQAPREIRVCYEKLRNLSLDNTAERQALGASPDSGPVPEPSAIPNFQRINEHYLRGGQPDQDGVNWLFEKGVNSVIDLRGDDRENQWAPPVWSPMKAFHFNIKDFGTPSFEMVEDFIETVDDPRNQPVFVHCKAGVGRTGLMTACWNVAHGVPVEEALKRERINSYHGNLQQEEFVRSFHAHLSASAVTGVRER